MNLTFRFANEVDSLLEVYNDGERIGLAKLVLLGNTAPNFIVLLDDGRVGNFRRDAYSAAASALNSEAGENDENKLLFKLEDK